MCVQSLAMFPIDLTCLQAKTQWAQAILFYSSASHSFSQLRTASYCSLLILFSSDIVFKVTTCLWKFILEKWTVNIVSDIVTMFNSKLLIIVEIFISDLDFQKITTFLFQNFFSLAMITCILFCNKMRFSE